MSEIQYAGSFTMTMSDSASNWDFFRGTLSDENCANWKVTINNEISTQKANNLTFKEGDIIKIEYDTTSCLFHPGHDSDKHSGHISSISGSLPYFNGTDPTAVSTDSSDIFRSNVGVFEECGDLTSISEDLFIHWENVTNFNCVFASAGYSAPELSVIPKNLFANNTKVTSFANAFMCYQSNAINIPIIIPEKLFYNNTLATNFEKVFAYRNISELPQNLFKNNPNILNMKGSFYTCSYEKEFSLNLTNCNNISDNSDFNGRSSHILRAYVIKDSVTDTSFISAGGEDESGAYVKIIYGAPLEINDQKLIDIVYVDDEGNKHKYSGPFINDLTITSEIQEKLTALGTLNTQIGELKTKLDTLNTTVSSDEYANTIQYMLNMPTGVASGVSNVYVTPSENACPIGIRIYQAPSTYNIGWFDLLKKNQNNNSYDEIYLGINKNIHSNFDPEQNFYLDLNITNKISSDKTKYSVWDHVLPTGINHSNLLNMQYEVNMIGEGGTTGAAVTESPVTFWNSESGYVSGTYQVLLPSLDVTLDISGVYSDPTDESGQTHYTVKIFRCFLGFKPEE